MASPHTFTSDLHPKHGFHPISASSLHVPAQFRTCTYHLLYSLPPSVFVDKYELANYRSSYSFQLWGTSNLELPVFALEQSNSTLLLTVEPSDEPIEVNVPLHLRYGSPALDSYVHIKAPEPVGFFSCPLTLNANVTSASMPQLPEEVVQFITQNSIRPVTFFPVIPATKVEDTLRVPVGRLHDLPLVEYGTVFTIFFLFWYLVRVAQVVGARLESRHEKKVE